MQSHALYLSPSKMATTSSSAAAVESTSGAFRAAKPQRKISPGGLNDLGLHSCVARIRAEDQHLAEDIIEGLEFPRDKAMVSQLASHVNNIFLASGGGGGGHSRRPSPSPLGSNANRAQPMGMLIEC